ncbi:MAG: hypothetical protein ABIA63_05590, partial [bacterium]
PKTTKGRLCGAGALWSKFFLLPMTLAGSVIIFNNLFWILAAGSFFLFSHTPLLLNLLWIKAGIDLLAIMSSLKLYGKNRISWLAPLYFILFIFGSVFVFFISLGKSHVKWKGETV